MSWLGSIARIGSGAGKVTKGVTKVTQPVNKVLTSVPKVAKIGGSVAKVGKAAPKISKAKAVAGLAIGGVVLGTLSSVTGVFDETCKKALGEDSTACGWLNGPRDAFNGLTNTYFGWFGKLGDRLVLIVGAGITVASTVAVARVQTALLGTSQQGLLRSGRFVLPVGVCLASSLATVAVLNRRAEQRE